MPVFSRLEQAIAMKQQRVRDDEKRQKEEHAGREAEAKRQQRELEKEKAAAKAPVEAQARKLDRAVSAGLMRVCHALVHEGQIPAGELKLTRKVQVTSNGEQWGAYYGWTITNTWELRNWWKLKSKDPFCHKEIDTYTVYLERGAAGVWELSFRGSGTSKSLAAGDDDLDRGLAFLYEHGPERDRFYARGSEGGHT